MTEEEALTSAETLTLQQTLDRSRATLELVAHKPAAQGWLQPAACSDAGTEELYGLLEDHVGRPEFAEQLAAQRRARQAAIVPLPPPASPDTGRSGAGGGGGGGGGGEVLQRDWWELRPDGNVTTVVPEATGDYIVVEKEDVVDALSQFIAAYLATLPEAQNLEPRQLQCAITTTLKELKKGRVRRLVDWGRVLYRVAAVGYGAFSAFSNPWVAKALVAALWTFVRMLGRLAF